ncbi:zinc finger FYVE domain-containing protein 26 isoform X1 [Parasteatoda tepidariorum]|uniref:zinc finger FYVE domain-containing protein 26 isoform X1 n=1 Tax=Parasteatoda tepidariorum TaxID=114398 RepID=UPI001C7198D7|nr:zinc finger FYVE domain-containing protein 26 isoform X1 [Parasteatoda tepidariorum]
MTIKMGEFLYREFCNHVYLGQWELARAFAVSLIKSENYNTKSNAKLKLLTTLQTIAKNPYLVRECWTTTPCPSYVSFWACQLLFDLGHLEESSKFKDQADFNILLETLFRTSKQVIKELSSIHNHLTEPENLHQSATHISKISDKCLTSIKNAFKENPAAISVLLNMLQTNKNANCGANINYSVWDIYYQQLLNSLKSLQSIKDRSNKVQSLQEFASRIYLLLSIIPDGELEENNLKDNLLDIQELCQSDILSSTKVYQSLLSRPSPKLGKCFCELKKVEKQSALNKNIPIFYSSDYNFNHQIAFLNSISSSKHFLHSMIEFCINNILHGHWNDTKIVLKDPLFSCLNPLPLILSWGSCHDDISAINLIHAIKMWEEPPSDALLSQVFKQFKSNITFTELCQNFYQEIYPNASPSEMHSKTRNILSNLQNQSPLRVIHVTFGLKSLSNENVLKLLDLNEGNDSVSKGFSILTDKAIYSGYQAINYAMEAIHLSCEYKELLSRKKNTFSEFSNVQECINYNKPCDDQISLESLEEYLKSHNPACAYAKFVTTKLSFLRSEIKQIFPVAFRVEILEDIFSLLFVMSDILINPIDHCSDSDQGHEGDYSVPFSQNEHVPSTQETSQSSESEKRFSGRFVISTVKLKDPIDLKKDFLSGHQSSKSTESNSSCNIQPYTFLCNELITRDLLFLLKDSVLEANAEAYKIIGQTDTSLQKSPLVSPTSENMPSLTKTNSFLSISNSELPERISKLLQYINEAIWRYEVVKSEIFRERYGVFSLLKKKHLINSTSASSSDGTDKETRKHKRKRKHKRSFSNLKKESFAESSIIQCMLSSPEALLRYSLWSKNLGQASQVIHSFRLEDSNEAKEVILTQELRRISKKLAENEKIKRKPPFYRRNSSVPEGNSLLSNLQAIEDAAAAGLQSSEIGLIIHHELSTLRIPEIVDITDGIRHPELMLGSENIYSIFLADLGYISSSSLELTSILFDMACRSWTNSVDSIQDLDAKVLSKKKMPLIRGNFKTLGMMNGMLKEFLHFLQQEDVQEDLKQVFWPLGRSSGSFSQILSNFIGNFDCKAFRSQIINWKQAASFLHDFIVLMKDEEIKERSGIFQKDISQENRLHITYKKLSKILRELRDWSSETIRPQPTKYDNYLSKLLIHLHQVTTAVLDCKKQSSNNDSVIYTSDFSILKESPVELLKKIILQSGVTPEKIEKFAIRMKVDLVHVLAQACLPHVPLLNKNASSDVLMSPSCYVNRNGYPLLVLNKKKEEWPSPQHPDLVARKLLKDMISMIQDTAMANDSCGIFTRKELVSLVEHSEMVHWMEDCSELCFVDLTLLKTREEKLAFFSNVTNIAWIHAILLEIMSWHIQEKENDNLMDYSRSNFQNTIKNSYLQLLSPNLLERLTTQKVLGYSIGQLGPVSLFDMRYQLLHAQLPNPKHLENPPFYHLLGDPKPEWEKYIPPLETRLIFVLIDGLMYSPKLKALHSEIIDEELEEAMKDYFDYSIKVDLQKEIVSLPKLIEWYSSDFSKDDEKDIEKAPYESLIKLISSHSSPQLADSFKTLFSNESIHNHSENADVSGRKQLPFSLIFKEPLLSIGIKLQYSTDHLFPSAEITQKATLIQETQPFVLNYLKEKCPLLNDLYEIFRGEYSPQINSKENFCLESCAQNLFVFQESFMKTPVTYLLTFYLNMLMTGKENQSWFSNALSPAPDREYFSQQIRTCFNNDEWHRALLYVDLYLEHFDKDWSYMLLRKIILEHIACDDLSYDVTDPCHYALAINDPVYRALTVLQNVYKWSDSCTIQALKYCLSDSDIVHHSDIQGSLKVKLKEVQLYKKIFDASEMFGDSEVKDCVYVFNNWQEVADCSFWDQSRILEFIKSCGKYELSVQWTELHVINKEQKLLAFSMNIIWFLTQTPPQKQEAFEIINLLEDAHDCVVLCDKVLSELPTIEAKLCIVQYLVDNNLAPEKKYYYFNLYLGLKMLSVLKGSTQELYIELISHPYLLLEQMLMNVELRDAEDALNAIRGELKNPNEVVPVMSLSSVNQLVEDYASKALEVHFLDALLDISSSSTLVLSTEDALVTDEPFVMPLRVPTKEEWVPDAKILRCQVCREEHFNMFSRRHHCRRCGRVVCANCSQHALIVEGYGNVKVRVCDDCYNLMTGSLSLTTASFEKRYRKLSTMMSSSPRSFENPSGPRRRTSSVHSQQMFRWVLSTDSEQNASVRNEFSYEQTPSISLCYSILKLHTDDKKCAQFLMNLCDRLLGKVKTRRSGKLPLEVDYSLIISMMKSLLMNAKVKCHQVQDSDGEALAELYFQHLDIIKLLVTANCRHLIPREALTNGDTVRKLRDKLLEEERMNLALEVSTKFNLDKNGVWSCWGLFCLKAGDWLTARAKFQQCLKIVKDKNDQTKENPILNKILKVLEESKYPGTEKAAAISRSLASLRNIKNGLTQFETKLYTLDAIVKQECLHYLNMYGTHFATIGFYRKHGYISEALEYITEKKCEPDVFIEALFMPILKNVQLSSLKQLMSSVDPLLHTWSSYLFATCRYLEKLKYLNVLYEIQLFMEDYARAAKSAINFYLTPAPSYKVLFDRSRFLHNAKKHYEKYLNNLKQSDPVNDIWRKRKNIKILNIKEVESYIQIISLQEEVSNYFQLCETQGHGYLHEIDTAVNKIETHCPPNLFGNSQMKSEVATMILINAVNIDDGFELAAKIIQIFNLNATAILCKAGREIVRTKQKQQVPHYLASVKCLFSKLTKVDDIILECVSTVHKQGGDVEDIIKMLMSDSNKINAYLMCGKLKSAYLLALKLNSALDIRRIMVAAEQCGQDSIQRICRKWLDTNSLKLKPKETVPYK